MFFFLKWDKVVLMRFSFVVMFWSFSNIGGWQKTEYHSGSLHRVCMNGLFRGNNFAYWAVDTHIKAIFSLHCSELIDDMYTTVSSILRLVFITHGDICASRLDCGTDRCLEQRWLSRACADAQTLKSLCCPQTPRTDVDKDSDHNIDP